MTQEKMRKIITACVSAATVLLVFLLGFLIYQWISMGVYNKKIDKAEAEVQRLEQEYKQAETQKDFFLSEFYLQYETERKGLIKD